MFSKTFNSFLFFILFIMLYPSAMADELLLSGGLGKQPGANQDNQLFALDYSFHSIDRSERSKLSFGVSYTKLRADASINSNTVEVFSFYPQLTLYPVRDSMQNMFFFVRALGPGYLSNNQFGERIQSHNFTFQAQVGVGYEKKISSKQSLILLLSWKHFSNADLFSDNDGIDIPLTFSIGIKY